MAIKWKSWTAHRPVKIICTALIVVMGFVFLLSAIGLANATAGMRRVTATELLFGGNHAHSTDRIFDDQLMNAHWRVLEAFTLHSPERIRAGDFIEWRSDMGHVWPVGMEVASVTEGTLTAHHSSSGELVEAGESWYRLVSTLEVAAPSSWGSIPDSELGGANAQRMVEWAIRDQLWTFNSAQHWLQQEPGLYYFITDGARTLTNLPEGQGTDFIMAQPVFLIEQDGSTVVQSRSGGHFSLAPPLGENITIALAYTQQMVDWQVFSLQAGQQHLFLMLGSFAASVVFLAVLLAGAGRVYGREGVHLSVLDKPWLDLGLGALLIYSAVVLMTMDGMVGVARHQGNAVAHIAVCAVFAALFTLPVIWWLVSVAKRCKAGKFWRHTLVCAVWRAGRKLSGTLWSGLPLTLKAVALCGVFFAACVFIIVIANPREPGLALVFSMIFTVSAGYFLLRYARKLHLVEQGAAAVSGGDYGARIDVAGGELGSIADSINNISGGMNAAVNERMKSERLKTELITNVSHDIRTPLTSLVTYTDLLKNEGLDSEKAPEYLDILIQKTARLRTLTDDLFEASKAASGSVDVRLESLDLADFVRQVLGEMSERVSASGLDFRLGLPEHATVRADGKLLWRVMENLLSNVFKYALAGSRVYVDVAGDADCYRLDIKNISQHPLNVEPSELTERFKRGDSARTGEGSGLGLSIAQSFAQSQGGRFALSIDGDLFKATVWLPREGTFLP